MVYTSGAWWLLHTWKTFNHHASFVRSVSMDTWSEDQIRRMQVCRMLCLLNNAHNNIRQVKLGGNGPFKDFMKSYPSDQGGYTEGMDPYSTYHSWAATEYKAKV
jgi:ADP-ribosylation factor GTPase-activating protein 1